jgi:hypothetical protein
MKKTLSILFILTFLTTACGGEVKVRDSIKNFLEGGEVEDQELTDESNKF